MIGMLNKVVVKQNKQKNLSITYHNNNENTYP